MTAWTDGYYNKERIDIRDRKCIKKMDDEWKAIHSSEVVGDTFLCSQCSDCIVCGHFHDPTEECIYE